LAQAAREVGAYGQRHDARGDEGRVAATRAPRSAVGGGGGMIRAAPDGIVGLVEKHRLRDVRLADDHRARPPQPDYDPRVAVVDRVPPAGDAERGPQAAHGEAFLDAHRHAGERARGVGIDGRRLRAGRREVRLDQCVEDLMRLAMPRHTGRQRVGGGQPTLDDGRGDGGRRHPPDLRVPRRR